MNRAIGVFAACCAVASAQFAQIAVSDDGSQIYFSSTLVPRVAPASARPDLRIFRLSAGTAAPELFAEHDRVPEGSLTSGIAESSLAITGEGSTVGFVQYGFCPATGPCTRSVSRAELRGGRSVTFDDVDSIHLSRNGRWALLVPPFLVGSLVPGEPPVRNTESTLVDLNTGERSTVGMPAPVGGKFALGSDGTVLVRVTNPNGSFRLGISRKGQLEPLPELSGGSPFSVAGMNDGATVVIVNRLILPAPVASAQPQLPDTELLAIDLRTGTARVIVPAGKARFWNLLGLSNDGRRVLFTSFDTPESSSVWLADARSGALTRVPLLAGERVVAGALSGDGSIAVLGTSAARLLRMDGNNPANTPEELLPAVPHLQLRSVSPGFRTRFAPPLPGGDFNWTGRILVNELPVAMLAQSAESLSVQFPWELRPGPAKIRIDAPSTSPLEWRPDLFIFPQTPMFAELPSDAKGLLGGHLITADFSGYVTEPLAAGDIVHIYWVGLGAVAGQVTTGEPAPLSEPRPVLEKLTCRLTPGNAPLEILFLGLAPGTVGVYQMTARIPPESPPIPNGIGCGSFGISYTPVRAKVPLSQKVRKDINRLQAEHAATP